LSVYYARIEAVCNEEGIKKAMQLLPEYRLEKVEKMQQEVNRQQSIAAGLLLEYGLREYGLSGKDMAVGTNADGKPYLLERTDIHYNLSHSGDYVALAMSDMAVGIDIEKLRIGKNPLAKRFFAEEEYQYLEQAWSDDAFTRMWTRKESVIKACGIGMRMPLDGFSTVDEVVRFVDERCHELLDCQAIYYLNSYQIGPDYWLSVCQKGKELSEKPLEVNIGDLWKEQ